MKKLMLAVAAVAIVGSASAVQVYTYKASVKHTYLKIKKVNSRSLYVRYTKNTSLDGYLVQDDQESLRTSGATISKADAQPGNRCFLVAKNKSPEKNFKFAAIIPGVIDVKWYDDKLDETRIGAKPVQGYLYLGGETVNATAYLGTTFDAADADLAAYNANNRKRTNWQRLVPAVVNPLFGIDDYFFTSAYLFGQYNEPAWTVGGVQEYGDTWMNHAGFGKMFDDSDACCGDKTGGRQLDTFSGNVKVGVWLCTESGDDKGHNDPLGVVRRGVYEDQLWKSVQVNNPTFAATYNVGVAADALIKLDMWADGNLQLGTTDVGYGTFSIKRTTKKPFDLPKNMATIDVAGEEANITGAWACPAPTGQRLVLLRALKTALELLKTDTTFIGDGSVVSKADNTLINASFYKAYLN